MNQYLSILKNASAEFVERKSRFICNVKPVDSEEEALRFIKEIGEIHRDASHNVFAYLIMESVEIQKASDDGEPQGTAGIPVLEVIKKGELKNICIVVTRYFGGTLLGAGGLIRSYSTSARKGVEAAGICTMSLYKRLYVETDYTYLGKLQNMITAIGNTIIHIEYTDLISLTIKIKFDRVDRTIKSIIDITSGSAKVEIQEDFFDIDD